MKYKPKNIVELFQLVNNLEISLADVDTSDITDMGELFYRTKRKDFSGIENWNTSNVINMYQMFRGVRSFNSNISSWDVSSVKYMDGMFRDVENFNQDLSQWNPINLVYLRNMFYMSGVKNIPKWFKD